MAELTLRGVILGALITLVFTAANVYLGLKIGLTFATSIPAAVISMAVLRLFSTGTILENNIVQTIASAAGTLSAIIFVLPGLVIIGWWQGFPYWLSAFTIATGGILGVMYSVPLRRALVTGSDLPYPEGVAAAEVLKVGAGSREGLEENKRGLAAIVASALSAATMDEEDRNRTGIYRNEPLDIGVDAGPHRVPGINRRRCQEDTAKVCHFKGAHVAQKCVSICVVKLISRSTSRGSAATARRKAMRSSFSCPSFR